MSTDNTNASNSAAPVFDVRQVTKEWMQDNLSDEMVKGITPEFRLTKKTDDPLCTRISIGGDLTNGQYLVYKGELDTVEKILVNCLRVVRAKIKSMEEPKSDLIL